MLKHLGAGLYGGAQNLGAQVLHLLDDGGYDGLQVTADGLRVVPEQADQVS